MSYKSSLAVALSLLLPLGGAAHAGPHRGEHEAAYSAAQSGDILPFPEIKHRVMRRMGDASFMGFDYDDSAAVYTLKLMRDGSVIWVDVDARTGTIIGRSGD